RPLGHGSIALAPVREGSEKGSGGPGWSRCLPAPSSFGGNGTLRSSVAGGPYRSTNSRPAAPAGLAPPPRPDRPLPPPPPPPPDPRPPPPATPDGGRGCRTACRGSASRGGSARSTPVDRSKKIRPRPLGADPRALGRRTRTAYPAPREARPVPGRP